MCDGLAKWASLCFFYIEVNPLMITCGIGEKLYLFLCDGQVVAVAQVLSNMGFKVFVVFDDCGHVQSLAIPDALVLTGLVVEEQRNECDVKGATDNGATEYTSGEIVGELDRRIEQEV